jgi:hypothetical protein
MGEGMKEVICPSVWVLAMENRLYNWMKASPSGMLAVIPDVRYSQELKLLQTLRKKGFRVFHYGIFRREALPDWWKLGLTPKTKEERAIIERISEPIILNTKSFRRIQSWTARSTTTVPWQTLNGTPTGFSPRFSRGEKQNETEPVQLLPPFQGV